MTGRTIKALVGKAVVAGVLGLGTVAVVSQTTLATTPPNYFVTSSGLATDNCHSFAAAHACTLAKALALAGAGDQIRLKAGVYSVAGDDAVNPGDGLVAGDGGVTIVGGYGGATTLEPGPTCVGNAIIDFSTVTGVRVRKLTVDSTASACISAVANAGGASDALGAAAAARVLIRGGTPAIAVDLTGGSTALVNVRTVTPSYTADGVVCTGSTTTCAVSHSSIVGGAGTVGIDVTSGATATIATSKIADNSIRGVVLQNVTGTTLSGNDIFGNAGGGVDDDLTTNVTMSGNTVTNNAGGDVIDQDITGGTQDCAYSNSSGPGLTISNSTNVSVGPCTFANDAGGGVLLEGTSTNITITSSTFTSDTAGGVVATGGNNQSTGDSVTNDVFNGTSDAGVELEETGGFSVTGDTIQTGSAGNGVVLAGSDNDVVASNTVLASGVGVYVTGNDVTGASSNDAVSNNTLNGNVIGAVADGYGSPATWNVPPGNQGIQGPVYFQSGAAVASGSISGMVQVVTSPAWSAVAAYLKASSFLCPTGILVYAGLSACTDGNGNIFLTGTVGPAIAVGTTISLSGLPSITTVAQGNTFSNNVWENQTLFGAIDGSGPYGESPPSNSPTSVDGNPGNPVSILNTWTGNLGSPTAACNPVTGPVPSSTPLLPPWLGPECGT